MGQLATEFEKHKILSGATPCRALDRHTTHFAYKVALHLLLGQCFKQEFGQKHNAKQVVARRFASAERHLEFVCVLISAQLCQSRSGQHEVCAELVE